MPKLAGRSVFVAALAVPIAMMAGPLAASADSVDPADVVTVQEGVAQNTTPRGSDDDCCPDGDVNVTEVDDSGNHSGNVNGIYHDVNVHEDTNVDLSFPFGYAAHYGTPNSYAPISFDEAGDQQAYGEAPNQDAPELEAPNQFEAPNAAPEADVTPAEAQDQQAPAEQPYEAPAQDQQAPAEQPYEAPVQDQQAPADQPFQAPVQDQAPADQPFQAPAQDQAPAEQPFEAQDQAQNEAPAEDTSANFVVPRGDLDLTAVHFSNTMAAATAEGAFIDSTDSSAVEVGRGGDGGGTHVNYSETTAFAGEMGAFFNHVESSAHSSD